MKSQDEVKQLLGREAVDRYVKKGMKIGLGTGSTAVWAVRRLGELLKTGKLSDILAVSTSSQTIIECQKLGIPIRSINDPEIDGVLDLTIDGADEVDHDLNCTKGGGGALLIEKIVAYASKKYVIIVNKEKIVEHLGITFPIPLEVIPEARVPVIRAVEALGAKPEVRMAVKKMGAVITDNGNILIDAAFSSPVDPEEYEGILNRIPGIVENGFFTKIKPDVITGSSDGSIEVIRPGT